MLVLDHDDLIVLMLRAQKFVEAIFQIAVLEIVSGALGLPVRQKR